MSEKLEQLKNNSEQGVEYSDVAEKRIEQLDNIHENQVELEPTNIESNTEKAREKALESAISVEKDATAEKEIKHKKTSSRRGPIKKELLNKSFTQTMKHVQNQLSTNERIFSKIIHNDIVEKTSDIVGSTIARPNAILAGAFMAFILTLLTYTVAKTIGYNLSGFETIAAFILGWVIGITYDYLKVLITGKKS